TAVPAVPLDAGGFNQANGFTINITVMADDGPVEGALVRIFGSLFPTQGVTGRQGRVELNVIGESPNTIHALYVKPQSDFWSIWIPQPALNSEGPNVISLKDLGATLPNLSSQQFIGWGQRAMHRSEEHTSELQSRGHLVCRLLLEKKKKKKISYKHK